MQIPQLDGLNEDLSNVEPEQPFKCETCGKEFEVEFCCDDCGICFSAQLAAHFHELEEHSESHLHTKLLFRSNQPKKT